jgi:hypothetical protein
LETIMKKSFLATVAALVVAASFLSSAAEAGMRVRLGFGGPLPSFNAYGNSGGYKVYRKKRHKVVRRKSSPKVHVAKKATAPKVKQAAVAPETKPADTPAVSQNSSISVANTGAAADSDAGAAKAPAQTDPAAPAAKGDCKQFFPSVGMTLSVPCE